MKKGIVIFGIIAATVLLTACEQNQTSAEKKEARVVQWKSHDMSRPRPQVVEALLQSLPAPAPPNAIVLFEGKDLSQWTNAKNEATEWKVENGYMEIVPGTGGIQTKKGFGDVYLHVEWASPSPAKDTSQDRGNSGIFLMGLYELQVLDSYHADTYADGQAGALYGQVPPRFNVCKAPGEWQAYDIFFRRPRFADDSSLISPASITVLHNGILIQDNEKYFGPTSWLKFLPYAKHADQLPLMLQEHNCAVRFRNIWALALPENANPPATYADKAVNIPDMKVENYTGVYDRPGTNAPITITVKGNKLFGNFFWRPGELEMLSLSSTEFVLKDTDAQIKFELDNNGKATALVFTVGGKDMPAKRAAGK
jgi:Domain of Unknown Function (DUF1080)/Domain of unknown function (DUF3471)